MNERIQELKDQCWVEKRWVYDQDNGMWIEKQTASYCIDQEKFAELIVRECANLFEIEYGTSEVSGNEVARVLKQRFGVEE